MLQHICAAVSCPLEHHKHANEQQQAAVTN